MVHRSHSIQGINKNREKGKEEMRTSRRIGAVTCVALLFIFSLIVPVACAISAGVNPPKFTIKAEYLQVNRSILVENQGDKPVTVNLTGEVEGVELEFGNNDFTLSPRESRDIPITFKITKQGYFSGEIWVKFSEEGQIALGFIFPCSVAIDASTATRQISPTPAPTPTPAANASSTPTPTPTSSPTPEPTSSPTPTPTLISSLTPTPLPADELNETEVPAVNETNATTNVPESTLKKEGKGIFGLPGYVAIGIVIVIVIVIVIASLFLYAKSSVKEKKREDEGVGDKSAWVVSGVEKKGGGEYEIAVNKGGKRTAIKLNEKSYRQLIKKKRLVIGNHTISIPAKR